MKKYYRVVIQEYEKTEKKKTNIKESVIIEEEITAPTNCFDFSIGMKKQLEMIKEIQTHVLNSKLEVLELKHQGQCKDCMIDLVKCGKSKSTFHDVFTDHLVTFQRYKCMKCGYETPASVRKFLGTVQSGELQKIQAELGARSTYRESERIFALFSNCEREINNHDRIKKVTESVGVALDRINQEEKEILVSKEASELIVNVDGGHIKTNEADVRSIEAITSVIYDPKALKSNSKDTRNHLDNKSCAASVRSDNQEQIIAGTVIAALKQGMGINTVVTALCDGAANCWSVVEALTPLCGRLVKILDWFHLSMKVENISLPKALKEKLLSSKWHLWRGEVDKALERLESLMIEAKEEVHVNRLKKFYNYIVNNKDKIVNYEERQNGGLVFTSNLAESTVESLINQRCKGQQHMRWSREGLNPVLQIRAALNSKNEWVDKWQMAVLNATQ
jgi:hypothetical protein